MNGVNPVFSSEKDQNPPPGAVKNAVGLRRKHILNIFCRKWPTLSEIVLGLDRVVISSPLQDDDNFAMH